MKKIILLVVLILSTLNVFAQVRIPEIPDTCSISCHSIDADSEKFKGTHSSASYIQARCSAKKALLRSVEKCQRLSKVPETCEAIPESCN